jgi:hypothetical protein
MCWNQTVSWVTFAMGTVVNLLLASWKADQKSWVWYVFFQLIIMVQLGEALIWRDPNGPLARVGTIISFLGVWLQPFMAWVILYVYGVRIEWLIVVGVLLLLYVVSSLSSLQQLSKHTYQAEVCSATSTQKHIVFTAWNSPMMGKLYMICCLLSMALVWPMFPYISSYLFLTLAVSLWYYKRSFASLWCWFAVLSAIVFTSTLSLPKMGNISWISK